MIEPAPLHFHEREFDAGLWRMVGVSGVLHLAAIALIIFLPISFAHHPPPLISYTVDLVAPNKVGGNNAVAGGKGRTEAPPLVAARPAPKPEPPQTLPKVEEVHPPEPKPEAQKVEPPKPEPPKPKEAVSKPEPPKPPEAKPKAEPQPKPNEAVLAEKVKKVEAPPSPAKPAPAKEIAKAEPPKGAAAKPSNAEAESTKKAAAEAVAARERDERIAAAVKRAEQQLGTRGGGTGTKTGEKPGGPISVGPGEGAGGQFIGVEYMLYYNALINRIKQSWAWAGADRSLEAVIRFSIAESGDVLEVRITHPSGDPSYDASVERAVKAVSPLPPPPEAFRKQFSDVELTFSPESLQM